MAHLHTGGVGRRGFVRGTAMAFLGMAGTRAAPLGALASWEPQEEDRPGQHNMLVVGEQTVFLSHLPMFQAGRPDDPAVNASGTEFTSPHRFQVILEATFTKQAKNVAGLYVKDRKAHPDTRIYTLEPDTDEPFVLSRLFTPAAAPQLRSFTGTVFRGHLEQGGEPIPVMNPSRVEITRVVHARKFNPKGQKPSALEYILFGKGSELFLAHAIFAPPDFDHVLSVKVGGREITDASLGRELRVSFPDRKNVAADRIRAGQKVSGMLSAPGDPGVPAAPVEVQASVEFYFEEGELLVPHTFGPTPEELKKQR